MTDESFMKRTGAVVIASCIAMLCAVFVIYTWYHCAHKGQGDKIRPVTIVVKTDSAGVVTEESRMQIKALEDRMEQQEHLIEDKYQYVLEQKETFNDVMTYGGMLVAIVVSLFGFFGYKSLNSMEERVEAQAKTKAEEAAKETFKGQFEKYKKDTDESLGEQVGTKVKEQFKKSIAEFHKQNKQAIDKLAEDAPKPYAKRIEALEAQVKNVENSLSVLDGKLARWSESVDRLTAESVKPKRGRRTLASGGKEEV